MSDAQNETLEPFQLHDPTKAGPVPTVNDKPLAAADVQRLIDASITNKFDSFRAELLQALKPVTGDLADCADTRAPSITARGGGTAAAEGSRSAKPSAGDLPGLSSGAASGEDTEESHDGKSVTSSSDSYVRVRSSEDELQRQDFQQQCLELRQTVAAARELCHAGGELVAAARDEGTSPPY